MAPAISSLSFGEERLIYNSACLPFVKESIESNEHLCNHKQTSAQCQRTLLGPLSTAFHHSLSDLVDTNSPPSRPGVYRKVVTQEKLKDAPEWTCVQLDVKLPPNGSSPPHRHGGANVFALVAEGEITSAMNSGEAKVYKSGETWYEPPGCKSSAALPKMV
jgi:hypothetical protein